VAFIKISITTEDFFREIEAFSRIARLSKYIFSGIEAFSAINVSVVFLYYFLLPISFIFYNDWEFSKNPDILHDQKKFLQPKTRKKQFCMI
jgi:hypothetical protein